ncbi:hypothetical protein BDBG_17405 [Blastomyces gilchristii SLH14081]|uniref:Calcium channel YVC1-like C-terminal transmembrane domain-containing protein n=1 Tax=Blastomyces gilchristii (strain SLH14081) TaxID=559298 RepID=A0A179URQ1_BLAGS|nr:uncharacterized protein BDBG_17405 [Blastomyces gilchristii SLH14081]OAT10714.1 hypothetical protein BDBG_17405 [Blastomyces gilchristii SLH14081]
MPGPRILSITPPTDDEFAMPYISENEPVGSIIRKLSKYIIQAIPDTPYSFDQMRATTAGYPLKGLATSLSDNVHNPSLISALMILKWQFCNQEDDYWGLNESRGYACEFVAWQFLTYLSPRDTIEYLLDELSETCIQPTSENDPESYAEGSFSKPQIGSSQNDYERRPLLLHASPLSRLLGYGTTRNTKYSQRSEDITGTNSSEEGFESDVYDMFCGLNALEIAAIANAKKLLSQTIVQKVVNGVWTGAIVLWDSLSVHSKKKPQLFHKRMTDPYCRLQVPLYRKAFEAVFFLSFLTLYYAVLMARNPLRISPIEILLYIWIAAFAYDEISGLSDTGMMFYQMNFWSLWDLGIIGTGFAFLIARIIGLSQGSAYVTDISFDILSLEALFLVPRVCSLMSLNSYFGSLIPVLKEMTKAFLKFLPVVVILYIGFLTTFTMLARDRLTLRQMSWILVKAFFGLNSLGFDIAQDISPLFGYPLMLVFVCMTNILLISSVTSLMSLSLTEIMAHAREEYLFQLSVYVLDSVNSRRLTYFLPPLNLIPLLCIRPLRLFLPGESIRRVRIVLLKVTHSPFVGIILAYESSRRYVTRQNHSPMATSSSRPPPVSQVRVPVHKLSLRHRRGFSRPVPLPGRDIVAPVPHRGPSGVDPGPTADPVHLADVVQTVDGLRRQVEQLAATISSNKNH